MTCCLWINSLKCLTSEIDSAKSRINFSREAVGRQLSQKRMPVNFPVESRGLVADACMNSRQNTTHLVLITISCMKIFNGIFIVVFILSAALQYNDPDPYIWMPVYLYSVLLCYLSITGKYYPLMYILGLIVYVGYAAILFFDKTGVVNRTQQYHTESIVQSVKATKPWIEETREFGGLMIVSIVLVINMARLGKSEKVSVAGFE